MKDMNVTNKYYKNSMEKLEPKELIIYGKQPVFEALKSNHLVSKIIIAREMEKKDAEKIESALLRHVFFSV